MNRRPLRRGRWAAIAVVGSLSLLPIACSDSEELASEAATGCDTSEIEASLASLRSAVDDLESAASDYDPDCAECADFAANVEVAALDVSSKLDELTQAVESLE
jgi:hypothetical protein